MEEEEEEKESIVRGNDETYLGGEERGGVEGGGIRKKLTLWKLRGRDRKETVKRGDVFVV